MISCWSPWSQRVIVRTAVGRPGAPPSPTVYFLNSTAVSVSWSRQFQLGAPKVSHWEMNVSPTNIIVINDNSASSKPSFNLTLPDSVPNTAVEVDLAQLLYSNLDCSNMSIVHNYQFKLRAVVQSDQGHFYYGAWSEGTIAQAYCSLAVPWVAILVSIVLVTVTLFFLLLCLCSSSRWFARKKQLFSRIGKGLDSNLPLGPAIELDSMGVTREMIPGSDQAVLLTPRHKTASDCSRDSGVSATTLCPPPGAGVQRQSSINTSAASGYLTMERDTSTPLSTLTPSTSLGYCQVVAPQVAPVVTRVTSTPGYISIGEVRTSHQETPYSRVVAGAAADGRFTGGTGAAVTPSPGYTVSLV